MLQAAIQHQGYSIVDCLQPCVTYNKINTYDWYQQRIYKVEEEPDYDPTNRDHGWEKAQEWGDRIPIGILYRGHGAPDLRGAGLGAEEGAAGPPGLNGRHADYEALKLEFV